MNSLKQRFDR